jgi:(p)ppGpp synthase/HD superfamily hydrolase
MRERRARLQERGEIMKEAINEIKEQQALAFATERHGDQRYGDEPYVVHLVAVHKIALEYKLSEDVRVAAYLHDVLEDTATTHQELRDLFGLRVADLVEAVTGRGANRKERSYDAGTKIIKFGREAAELKLCDRIANAKASRLLTFKSGTPFRGSASQLFRMYRNELPAFEQVINVAMQRETDTTWCLMLGRLMEVLS